MTLISIIIFTRCHNEGGVKKTPKLDSEKVIGLYRDAGASPDTPVVRFGPMVRYVQDVFTWVGTDSITQKKKWIRDSAYKITYYITLDSLTAKRNNKVWKDSTGKSNVMEWPIMVDKKWVRSGWENYDSAVHELMRQK